jgi:hypothetical protein
VSPIPVARSALQSHHTTRRRTDVCTPSGCLSVDDLLPTDNLFPADHLLSRDDQFSFGLLFVDE